MAFERRHQGDAPVRLNKWLAHAGVCSRREADDLIAAGRVQIDGATVTDAGRKVEPGQTVSLGEEAVEALDGVTIVMNKPVGYVSGQPEPGKIPAVRLLSFANQIGPGQVPARDASLPPIGRLDEDSHGLLLLSSDGVVARAVISPQSPLTKEYLVSVTGQVTESALSRLRHGLALDGRNLKPAKVTQVRSHELRFILNEGRKRQIRRMCDLVGLHVHDLQRIRIGPLQLGDLPEGKWRYLTAAERQALIAS